MLRYGLHPIRIFGLIAKKRIGVRFGRAVGCLRNQPDTESLTPILNYVLNYKELWKSSSRLLDLCKTFLLNLDSKIMSKTDDLFFKNYRLILILLVVGFSITWILLTNYGVFTDEKVQQYWKNSTIDEWSCEMLQINKEFIVKHTRDQVALQEVDRLWQDGQCDYPDSIYWRGKDWRPEGFVPYWQSWFD